MESISALKAREILGDNIFGIEDWSAFYGLHLLKDELRNPPDFPWSSDILSAPCPFVKGKKIKETHFAFLGLETIGGRPLTILRFHKFHPSSGQPFFKFHANPWYGRMRFAKITVGQFRWDLMPIEILPNSTDKNYEEAASLLPLEYEMPFAMEEVMKNIFYFRKTGLYPNGAKWGWCQDIPLPGLHVRVGRFSERGLTVYLAWDGCRDPHIGVGACRLPGR